jgi:hypothetical protein
LGLGRGCLDHAEAERPKTNGESKICHRLLREIGSEAISPELFLASGAILDGNALLPGFRYPTVDLFKEWDWE